MEGGFLSKETEITLDQFKIMSSIALRFQSLTKCALTLYNFTACLVRNIENKSHEVSPQLSSSNGQKKEITPNTNTNSTYKKNVYIST